MSENQKFAYSDEEGKYLVRLARESLSNYLKVNRKIPVPNDVPDILKMDSGVFVTLNIYSEGKEKLDLRGCIGRPYPEQSLVKATIDSAIDSGLHDWRFSKVMLEDINHIVFEVTALTPPVLIEADTPQGRLDVIEIGRDGLILERKNAPQGHGGLFLPQVPVEWHWNKEQYLTELCGKAGLQPNIWKSLNDTNLYKFRGEIFHELKPNGDIERKML
ncbi:MAG: TIGR00296 family protein [Promethearchaeota archaeon]